MSVTPELLTFGVGVDTSAAEAGLASLGDSADGVAVGLQDRLSGASVGLKDLGKGSTTAARGMSGVADAVALVNPKLAASIRTAATLTRSLQVLRVSALGPLGVALAALTGAYVLYSQKQAESERIQENARNIADALKSSQEALEQAYINTGAEVENLTRKELELMNIRRQSFVQNQPQTQEFIRQITEQSKAVEMARAEQVSQIERLTAATVQHQREIEEGGRGIPEQLNMLRDIAQGAINATEAERDALQGLQSDFTQYTENISKAVDLYIEEAIAIDEGTAAKGRRLSMEDQLTEALILQEELRKEATAAQRDMETDEERINRIYEERLDLLDRAHAAGVSQRELVNAAAEFERQHFEEIQAIRDRQDEQARAQFEDMQARKRADHAETMRQIEEQNQAIAQNVQDMSQLFGAASSLISDLAGLAAGEDEEAQARAAKLEKGLNIAGALIGGVVGVVVNTLLGNPAGAVASGLGGASGVIRAATAHQGDRIAPDEEMVRTVILRDEKITPDARVISPEGSRRMERGEDGGAHVVTVPIYQHFGEFFADVVEGGGTPLHDLINQGRDVGRRRA